MIHLIAPDGSTLVHLAMPAAESSSRWRFLATAEAAHRAVLEPAAWLSEAGIRSQHWGEVVRLGIEVWKNRQT